ncbi:hypothetical protein ACFVDI_14350 [Nocardioides sp. NPDC057767]|uniref:hypothetical protein n=1 Tax=unclassified Nocardioides TaxID=2615069 RepID=UPI00366BD4BE
MSADQWTADTLVGWITKSLTDGAGQPVSLAEAVGGIGYLEGVHQTCLLLNASQTWDEVARRLVEAGVLEMGQRRFTSGLAEVTAS